MSCSLAGVGGGCGAATRGSVPRVRGAAAGDRPPAPGALRAARYLHLARRCCACPEPQASLGRSPVLRWLRHGAVAGSWHAMVLGSWHGAVPGSWHTMVPGSWHGAVAPVGAPSRGQVARGLCRRVWLRRCFLGYANPGVERDLNRYTHSQIFLNKAIYSILQQ